MHRDRTTPWSAGRPALAWSGTLSAKHVHRKFLVDTDESRGAPGALHNEEYDYYDEARLKGISDHDPEVAIGIGLLEGLLDAMSEEAELPTAVDRLLEAVVSLLSLSRASLELVEERNGVAVLNPLAAAGEHAALTRDMPPRPLRSSADAAEAVATRSPVLVGDVHGVGEHSESESGISRWRAGMSAQAYAVLPLVWRERDRTLGVLTLEWSAPHEFEPKERDALAWMANSLATAVGSFSAPAGGPAATGSPATPVVATAPTRVIRLGFDPSAGISTADDTSPAPTPALNISFAISAPEGDRSSALWDLIQLPEGEAVVVAGVAEAPAQGAALLAERARQVLRASLLAGTSVGRSLATLAQWVRGTAQAGASVSAGICRVNALTGELQAALGNGTSLALLGREGRLSLHSGHADEAVVERGGLALAGDRLALMAGDADEGEASLEGGEGRAAYVEALHRDDAIDAPRLLKSLVERPDTAPQVAGIAVLVEIQRLGSGG